MIKRISTLLVLTILLLSNQAFAQGGFFVDSEWSLESPLTASIVAAAIAVPVAIHNDDEDAKDGGGDEPSVVTWLDEYEDKLTFKRAPQVMYQNGIEVFMVPSGAVLARISFYDILGLVDEIQLTIPQNAKLLLIDRSALTASFVASATP